LTAFHYFKDLLPQAEKRLRTLMGVEKGKILLKNPTKDELFGYSEEGTLQSFPTGCGIVGKVMQNGEYESVTNAYNHPLFNGVVDIETSMPLLCFAMKHPSTGRVMGAVQVINAKGIQGLAALQRASVNPLDLETLDFFTKHLAQAALNCFEWERVEAGLRGERYDFGGGSKANTLFQQDLETLPETLAAIPKEQ